MQLGGVARGACVALVVAVVFAALGQVGVAGAAGQPDDQLAGAAKLIGFIPKDVRYGCTIETNAYPGGQPAAAGTVLGALQCPGTDGVDSVQYFLFATNAAMNSVYAQVTGPIASQPVRSTAGNCPSDVTWDFGSQQAGRHACYYTNGYTDRVTGAVTPAAEYVADIWTYDAQDILAIAAMPQGNTDAVALQSWWKDKAGPTQTAVDVAGVVTSHAGAATAARELLRHVPPVTQKSCKTIDVSDATESIYASRLWIRGAVVCGTSGGADVVEYDSIAPAAVAPYFAGLVRDATAAESSTQPKKNCPDTGNYTVGTGKKRRTAGQFACLTDQKSTSNNGAAYARYEWTDPKLGIFAFADNFQNDPDALITWFDGPKAGPVTTP